MVTAGLSAISTPASESAESFASAVPLPPEIIATLSGDDTIFIATQNISQQNKIKIKLNKDFT